MDSSSSSSLNSITPTAMSKIDITTITESETGALRANKGKLPLFWVPGIVTKAIATVLWKNSKSGGGKYPDNNWKKGANYSTPVDSMLRHLHARMTGEKLDPESGLLHSWHILTNAAFLVFYEEKFPELDDLKE